MFCACWKYDILYGIAGTKGWFFFLLPFECLNHNLNTGIIGYHSLMYL